MTLKWPTYLFHRWIDRKTATFRISCLTIFILIAMLAITKYAPAVIIMLGVDRWMYILLPSKYTT